MESILRSPQISCDVFTPVEISQKHSFPHYDGMVISPGPGLPQESTFLMEIVRDQIDKLPILGVCLGLQALIVAEGGELLQLSNPLHGRSSQLQIIDKEDGLYRGLQPPIHVGHYHSWYVRPSECPGSFVPTAIDERGRLMSMRHIKYPVWAVQYHPESFLCPQGDQIISNFIQQL